MPGALPPALGRVWRSISAQVRRGVTKASPKAACLTLQPFRDETVVAVNVDLAEPAVA